MIIIFIFIYAIVAGCYAALHVKVYDTTYIQFDPDNGIFWGTIFWPVGLAVLLGYATFKLISSDDDGQL